MRQKGKCCRRKWRVERGGDGAWKGEKDGAAAHAKRGGWMRNGSMAGAKTRGEGGGKWRGAKTGRRQAQTEWRGERRENGRADAKMRGRGTGGRGAQKNGRARPPSDPSGELLLGMVRKNRLLLGLSPVCPRVAYSPGAAPFPVLYRLFSWVTPVPPGFPFGSFRIPFVAFGVFSGSFPRFSGFRDLRAPSTLTFTNRAPFDPHSHKPFPGWRPPGGLLRTAASGAAFFGPSPSDCVGPRCGGAIAGRSRPGAARLGPRLRFLWPACRAR